MPFTNEPTIWGVVGAILGASATFILGLLRIHRDSVSGLTRAQREMLEATWKQAQLQAQTISTLQQQVIDQQQYYEARLVEMREGYKKALDERDAEINMLRDKIIKLERHVNGGTSS